MMSVGDSASFIVRTDSTFMTLFQLPTLPTEFSKTDVMRFDIKLNDFYPESEFANKQMEYMKKTYKNETENAENELNKYLKENKLNPIRTESGLYYLQTKSGNGENPQVGTQVKVHYTGKLLDGTVFDSSISRNEPIQFDLGVGQVIPGWDEGIRLMSKGEKGILFIPYYLGYGDRGAGAIPPFATLIFDVELVDF
ncbi:MAG: FKBP-type peptidyl-prolyl cis-trans isomerase [Bacteroidales bacterium]|nr:FKBP-type peptidyl-prolyl cis-trans isomerase [Bacteroidales bacterium]